MKSLVHSLILVVFFLIISCQKESNNYAANSESSPINVKEIEEIKFNSPEQLISYVGSNENGYFKEKEIDEIKYSALYKPIDYVKAIEALKTNGSNVNSMDDLQYFDFRITVKDFKLEFLKYNLNNTQEYSQRVNYCAFDMENDISLIDGKDTLKCVMYHFERAYDVVPFGHFILAFPASKNKQFIGSKTLSFYDKIFNKGLIKFTFTPNHLIKVPKLNNL